MANRGNANTLKYGHIYLPRRTEQRDLLKSPLAREIVIDSALIAICTFLLGWVALALVHSYRSWHMIF